MKVLNLTADSLLYTSNVYLVTGTWNTMQDMNTLVDAGRDENVIEKINTASTGVGKHKVDQIILTHNHYDHAEMLSQLKNIYGAKVYAFSKNLQGVDTVLVDGDQIKIADEWFEVIYSPGHSNDSICLYCKKSKVLFAGDSPLILQTPDSTYEEGFIKVLERLEKKAIDIIYFGHGQPYTGDCQSMLRRSLENARQGKKTGQL